MKQIFEGIFQVLENFIPDILEHIFGKEPVQAVAIIIVASVGALLLIQFVSGLFRK